MRKYDAVIAESLGWSYVKEEHGTWVGNTPDNAHRREIPHYTTDVVEAMLLLHMLPEWHIIHDKQGFSVDMPPMHMNSLPLAICAAYIAARTHLDIIEASNTPISREERISTREIRRI